MARAEARRFKTTTTRARPAECPPTTSRTSSRGPLSTSFPSGEGRSGSEVVRRRGFWETGKRTSSCRRVRARLITCKLPATLPICEAPRPGAWQLSSAEPDRRPVRSRAGPGEPGSDLPEDHLARRQGCGRGADTSRVGSIRARLGFRQAHSEIWDATCSGARRSSTRTSRCSRAFRSGREWNLQLRLEAFNVFNIQNWDTPANANFTVNTNATTLADNVGRISTLAQDQSAATPVWHKAEFLTREAGGSIKPGRKPQELSKTHFEPAIVGDSLQWNARAFARSRGLQI